MDTSGSFASNSLDNTSSLKLAGEGDRVPRAAVLDAWASDDSTEGITFDQVPEMETIVVQTQNSVYEITFLTRGTGEVLVRGGRWFPQWTPAIFSGCTMGGTILKRHGIYLGLRMEFAPEPVQMHSEVVEDPVTGQKEFKLGHAVIVTSPVQSIGVVR